MATGVKTVRNNNTSLSADESTLRLVRHNLFGDCCIVWPSPMSMSFQAMEPIDYFAMGQNDKKTISFVCRNGRMRYKYIAAPIGCYRLVYETIGDRTTVWLTGVPGLDRVPIVTDTIRPRVESDGSYVRVSEHTLAHLRLFVTSHPEAYLRISRENDNQQNV